MRGSVGLAMILASIAMPAAAQETSAGSTASGRLRLLPLGTTVTTSAPVGRNLRVRVDTATATAAPSARVQSRLSGSMVDFYPSNGAGFHLSAGTKLFMKRDLVAESNRSTHGLLSSTRLPGGSPQLGKRHPTPALTMGYTGEVATDTSIGVEVGALRGRSYATADEMARHHRGGRDDVHPMLNLVIGRRF